MKRPRSRLVVALLALLALLAAACGGEEADTGAGGGGFEAGPLGAVTLGPDDPVKIASIQAITGEVASLGEDQVRATQIAIDDLGGKFHGHPIELQSEDDGCAAEAGTTAAQKVVSDEQIVGIIGTSCSGAAVPAAQIISEAGLVMISGSNTSPDLTSLFGKEGEAHQEGYFRTAHNDEIQGAAAATYAYDKLKVTKAASIHDGDPYTEGLADSFNRSFEDIGGTITKATAISKGDTDMRPVLTEVEASGAELVYFPIFQPEADFIIKQSREIGFKPTSMMAADGVLSDTYDETMILFEALEKVVVEEDDGTLNIDRQELRDAVGATSGYNGITGTLTCDEFGDCADPNIQIFQNTPARKTIE